MIRRGGKETGTLEAGETDDEGLSGWVIEANKLAYARKRLRFWATGCLCSQTGRQSREHRATRDASLH